MKITIDINGQSTEIELTKEQVASIEAQAKPTKFEWEYDKRGSHINFRIGETYVLNGQSGEYDMFVDHGRYRLSKEVAEQSLARNKRANRLEALAEQLGGLKESEEGFERYYIVYWQGYPVIQTEDVYIVSPERVYMTQACAVEICRLLNEGEFSLEGEQNLTIHTPTSQECEESK